MSLDRVEPVASGVCEEESALSNNVFTDPRASSATPWKTLGCGWVSQNTIGMEEIITFEQQWLGVQSSQGVGKTLAELVFGPITQLGKIAASRTG